MAKRITYGDFRQWAITQLHTGLERAIEMKQDRRRPYYILVIIKKGYLGPPAASAKESRPQQTMDFSKLTMFTTRIAIMDAPPLIPQIGSALWYINNVTGEVRNIYVLPPDMPSIAVDDDGEGSELVHKCGKNMPLVYSKKE